MKIFLKKIKINNILLVLKKPNLILISINYVIKRFLYDIFYFFKKDKYKYNIIFIAGMPMSATTKIKNMCARINGYFTRSTPMPLEIMFKQNIADSAFKNCPSWSYSLFKTHLNPLEENIKIIKRNNVKKIIVSYRDLRDVVVARYYRLLKFPKKSYALNYENEISHYKDMTKTEAINDCIEKVPYFVKWIEGWFDISSKEKDFILFCKFEDLITQPKEEFKKILDFYEINLGNSTIDHIVNSTEGKKNMEENFEEAKLLPWGMSSNFRSGKIGSWKNEFDQNNIKKFKTLAGESLIKLNYEKNMNW